MRLIAFATKGTGSNEEERLRRLLSGFTTDFLPFDKKHRLGSLRRLLRELWNRKTSLIVMEGTGVAGGIACLFGRLFRGHRYVFSSGDAVGPFIGTHIRWLGPLFGLYERVLCRFSSGFIGWTPYLAGRALTFGAPRAMTAAGWVIGDNTSNNDQIAQLRQAWGVSDDCIVFGIAGAIVWSKRRKYCYGLELIRALRKTIRPDIKVVIIGDGDGLEYLKAEAGDELGKRVLLPGRVPLNAVMQCLGAFDVASLPQSVDGVGSFRYTTKISEYVSAGLPIVTTRIPAAYDLDLPVSWRLPGNAPWDVRFVDALASIMNSLTRQELVSFAKPISTNIQQVFDVDSQVERVTNFISELVEDLYAHNPKFNPYLTAEQ